MCHENGTDFWSNDFWSNDFQDTDIWAPFDLWEWDPSLACGFESISGQNGVDCNWILKQMIFY